MNENAESLVISAKSRIPNTATTSSFATRPIIVATTAEALSNPNGTKITLVDNRMYIGAIHKDLFELEGIDGTNIEEAFNVFYDEIEAILKLIDEIKNNNKVFKM